MVIEVANITVQAGTESAFIAAYTGAREMLASTPGCRSVRMTHGIESPARFVPIHVCFFPSRTSVSIPMKCTQASVVGRLMVIRSPTLNVLASATVKLVAPAAIVGYSGLFVLPNNAEPDAVAGEIKSRPPVLLVHGDQDDLIPVEALFHATQALAALEVPTEFHISAGIGHGIDQEGLRHGGEFLARRLRGPAAPPSSRPSQ